MVESHIRRDGAVVLTPNGELDWNNSVSLRHLFHDALIPGATVIVDLRRATSVDAVGLSALVGGTRRARSVGAVIRIRNARLQTRRRMQLVGLEEFTGWGFGTESNGHDAA